MEDGWCSLSSMLFGVFASMALEAKPVARAGGYALIHGVLPREGVDVFSFSFSFSFFPFMLSVPILIYIPWYTGDIHAVYNR